MSSAGKLAIVRATCEGPPEESGAQCDKGKQRP